MPLLTVLAMFAATGGEKPAPDEAIVITGERTRRSSKQTASSHEVFSGREVDRLGIDTVEEFLSSIPNVQVGSNGTAPAIRGQDGTGPLRDLPAFLSGIRPRTALQIDGREAGYFELVFGSAPLWDIEQIEVFRGPQTVTQGRNAIAGAIFVTTRDPTFNREVRGRAMIGNYHLRSGAFALSGPLVTDQAALRVSAEWRRSDPDVDIGDNMRGASPDTDRHFVGRAKMLVEPKGLPWLALRLGFQHVQVQAPQSESASPPFSRRRNPGAAFGIFGIGVDAMTMQADGDFGGNWRGQLIATAGRTRSQRYAPANFGEAVAVLHDRSVEMRLERKTANRRITAGLYVQDGRQRQQIDISRFAGIGRFRERRTSIGMFGEVEQSLGNITLDGALRFQYDRQAREGGFAPSLSKLGLNYDLKTSAILPRASIAYDVSDDWRVGALVQKATSPSGGIVPLLPGSDGIYRAETLWDGEVFVRGKFAGGRGSLNLNAFQYWMKDHQRSYAKAVRIPGVPVFTLAEVVNIPKAMSRGMEANFRFSLTPYLTMLGGIGLLQTKIVKSDGNPGVAEGNRLARAPNVSGNFGVDWTPPGGWLIALRGGGRTGYFSDDANTPSRRVHGHWTLDGRIEKKIGHATLFAYGRNLLDKFGYNFFLTQVADLADPREFGAGVDVRF